MRKNTNWSKIEGRIYQHNLEIKQVKNQESANIGKDFISGTIEVAVDDNLTNIIPIHYTYVAPTYSSGKPNQTYHALDNNVYYRITNNSSTTFVWTPWVKVTTSEI